MFDGGRKKLDLFDTRVYYTATMIKRVQNWYGSRVGEGNGSPLQCSCLENPRDGGAWGAAVYGVAQSRTRLSDLAAAAAELDLVEQKKLKNSFKCICKYSDHKGILHWWEKG